MNEQPTKRVVRNTVGEKNEKYQTTSNASRGVATHGRFVGSCYAEDYANERSVELEG